MRDRDMLIEKLLKSTSKRDQKTGSQMKFEVDKELSNMSKKDSRYSRYAKINKELAVRL